MPADRNLYWPRVPAPGPPDTARPSPAVVRIVSVIGTRPQMIKAAALSPVLRVAHEEILVDTGQHYDDDLAGEHLDALGLARPDHALGIGSAPAAEQISRMLLAVASVLGSVRPDAVLVYGDTNSTIAGAIAGVKAGLPVAHVEAGLRSFDRRMPEETNRIVTDHVARWLFAPTPTAVQNLAAEGIREGVSLVGDVMQDLAARVARDVRDPATLAGISSVIAAAAGRDVALRPGGFLFATIHRAENREPAALRAWAELLAAVASPERPVILALHPGTRVALDAAAVTLDPAVVITPPLGYRTTLALALRAAAVLTDSGGLQREASWLGTPCLILRSTTEWVEAVAESGGTMVVVGSDHAEGIRKLAELAPPDRSEALATERAARLRLEPSGATAAIAAALR
jgi:UDP-GlcNAc3NAcA epimerase